MTTTYEGTERLSMSAERLEGQREVKRISVSKKRQISIPKEFYDILGIKDEVLIELENNRLVIRPMKEGFEDFSEYILRDLVREGYEGDELLEEFSYRKSQIRPALMHMLREERPKARRMSLGELEELFDEDDSETE